MKLKKLLFLMISPLFSCDAVPLAKRVLTGLLPPALVMLQNSMISLSFPFPELAELTLIIPVAVLVQEPWRLQYRIRLFSAEL